MVNQLVRGVAILACWAVAPMAVGEAQCDAADGMQFICGPVNAEDLVWVGDSGLLIASGMANEQGKGRIYLIDPDARTYEELYPGRAPRSRFDEKQFPDCPGVPNPALFSSHGLAIRAVADGKFRLYATAHGAREAVEVFEVDIDGAKPSLTWMGCVPMPDGDSINSVVALADGGFLTTRISGTDGSDGAAIFTGGISGFLYEWHPSGAIKRVPVTEMSGPNGIDVSADGKWVYVASWGRGEVARFALRGDGTMVPERTVDVGFRVDNLRFTASGSILLAGHRLAQAQDCGQPLCFTEWEVAEMDPNDMSVKTLAVHKPRSDFLGATVAVRGAGGLWLGTFHGDRIVFIAE